MKLFTNYHFLVKRFRLVIVLYLTTLGVMAQTPVLLHDINPTGSLPGIGKMVRIKSKTLFLADDGVHGTELWITDGTSAGTTLLKDINPSPGIGGVVSELSDVMKGKVYFSASTNGLDFELWVSDGTVSGTKILKNNTGNNFLIYAPQGFCATATKVYYQYKYQLWVTNGTAAGTMKIDESGTTAGACYPLCIYNDKLVYYKTDPNNLGNDLYITDGSVGGETLLIDASQFGSRPNVQPVTCNGLLYFVFDDWVHHSELWVSDGTPGGTQIVKDIIDNSVALTGNEITRLKVFNDKVYFAADNDGFGGNLGYRPWVSDGTDAGTVLLKNIDCDPELVVYDNKLFFCGNYNGTTVDFELMESDGTEAGTILFKDLNNDPAVSSRPGAFFTMGEHLYFSARANLSPEQYKLFQTDGIASHTVVLDPSIISNSNPLYAFGTGVSNGKLYLLANYDESIGYELYTINANDARFIWTGTVSRNWFDKNNWSNGEIPTLEDDVLIPDNKLRYPILGSGSAVCRNLDIEIGAKLSMTGGILTVWGELKAMDGLCLELTGGKVILNHGCKFPSGALFNDLNLVSLSNIENDNTFEVTGFIGVQGNLTMKGSQDGNDPSLPYLYIKPEGSVVLMKNLTVNQGTLGMKYSSLPISDNTKLPSVNLIGTTIQNVKMLNNIDPGNVQGIISGFNCNLVIENENAKLLNQQSIVECYNLILKSNFDLRGNYLRVNGKINYEFNFSSPYRITNSKPSEGTLEILNVNIVSSDNDIQYLNIAKLRSFYYSSTLTNKNVTLFGNLHAESVVIDGDLNLFGSDLRIGSTLSDKGFINCGSITTNVAQGTIYLLGNSSCPRYQLIAGNINNLVLNNPAGMELNNVINLPNYHPFYGKVNLYGTARLIKGNIDLKKTQVFLESEDQTTPANVGLIIETPGNTFTSSLTNNVPPIHDFFVVKDTVVASTCTNINIGGLGFFITCNNPLNAITMLRIPETVNGVNGGVSINRVFAVSNPGAGNNINAQIMLAYDESELQGINEGNLTIFRHSDNEPNGVWNIVPSTVNASSNTVTANSGLSQIDYSTSGPGGVTFYTLGSISAPLKTEETLNNQFITSKNNVLVYPNPFISDLNVSFNSEFTEVASMQLIDITGKVMNEEKVQLVEGFNDIQLCCTEQYSSGIYFLRIISLNTNNIVKVIKK